MELQEVFCGEGELTVLNRTFMIVVEVDVFLKGIRPWKVMEAESTDIVVIFGTFFIPNLSNTFCL